MPSPNPYRECIVRDPEASPAVTVLSYHHDVLETVLERVRQGVDSRNNQCKATVLISANPGMGKTHLLARFIELLGSQAFPVFVPPIHETRGLARGVLDRMVSRLWRMRGAGGVLNQFEWLALQLFAASSIDDPVTAQLWREFPLTELDQADVQDDLRERRETLAACLARGLEVSVAENLNEQPLHWAHAFLDILSRDVEMQSRAVDWIKGRLSTCAGVVRENDVGGGLSEPEDEISRAERRFYDLIRLFAVVRPVVFVFDQVENFEAFGQEALRSLIQWVERTLACSSATHV
ncbi:MAG: hypothetical protein ABL994_17695, partial [Verrucomicrobiales bacterium]